MRMNKVFATVTAVAALAAVAVTAMPSKAEAYVIYGGGVRVWAPAPVVVVRPQAYYYAPPAVVYVAPQNVWVPAHYEGPYFVPGHWA